MDDIIVYVKVEIEFNNASRRSLLIRQQEISQFIDIVLKNPDVMNVLICK